MYTRQTFTDRIGSRDSQKRFALLIRPCWSDSINQSNGIIDLSSELIRGSEGWPKLTNTPVGFPESSRTISPPSIVAGRSPRSFKMAGETHSAWISIRWSDIGNPLRIGDASRSA
jgi:hypothetical protein